MNGLAGDWGAAGMGGDSTRIEARVDRRRCEKIRRIQLDLNLSFKVELEVELEEFSPDFAGRSDRD